MTWESGNVEMPLIKMGKLRGEILGRISRIWPWIVKCRMPPRHLGRDAE